MNVFSSKRFLSKACLYCLRPNTNAGFKVFSSRLLINSCLILSVIFAAIKPTFAVDFQSSRILSLSQSGRGGPLLNESITVNSSMLGFQPIASFSGTYNWIATQPNTTANKLFNVSVIDGKNPYVNAGLSFTRRSDIDLIHVALAKRVWDWVSLGVLAKRYSTRSNTLAAAGLSSDGIDGGVSASFIMPKDVLPWGLQLGITGDNLRHLAGDEKFIGPRQAGLGLKVNINDILMLYGDWVENFSHTNGTYPLYSGGSEIALGSNFFARGGLMGFREKTWSAGLGWVGPRLGVSYGYQNKKVAENRSFQHSFTMDIFM